MKNQPVLIQPSNVHLDSWDETFWAAEGRALVRTAKKKGGALLRP